MVVEVVAPTTPAPEIEVSEKNLHHQEGEKNLREITKGVVLKSETTITVDINSESGFRYHTFFKLT